MGSLWYLQSQLLVAIQNNDVSRVQTLLKQGLDPDIRFHIGSQTRPAICLCVERGSMQLLELMLSMGCSINQCDSMGLSALHIAAKHTYEKMVRLLLKCRSSVNAVTLQGHTPLHLASQTHSIGVVKMLVEAGADVNRYDDERKTPLLNACIHGHRDVANYLIEHEADVNVCSPCGNTPLLFAASAPHLDIQLVVTLLKMKASSKKQNRQGESPLHAVIRSHAPKRLEAIDLLLVHDCDVNAQTSLGHTPLHLAVLEHDEESVSKLVKAGCAIDCEDELGLTPLFYVVREGNRDLTELLMAAGAQIKNQRWLKDVNVLANIRHLDLVDWLVLKGKQCPSLVEVCRLVLRNSWGVNMKKQIEHQALPPCLKQYLLLEKL